MKCVLDASQNDNTSEVKECQTDVGYPMGLKFDGKRDISDPRDCQRLCTGYCHIWMWIRQRDVCALFRRRILTRHQTPVHGAIMGTKDCLISEYVE